MVTRDGGCCGPRRLLRRGAKVVEAAGRLDMDGEMRHQGEAEKIWLRQAQQENVKGGCKGKARRGGGGGY